MPKKRHGKKRMQLRMVPMQGTGFFGDLWDGIKSVGQAVVPVLKSTGIAGNLASAYNPAAGAVVKSLGFGKRKMKGRGTIHGVIKV